MGWLKAGAQGFPHTDSSHPLAGGDLGKGLGGSAVLCSAVGNVNVEMGGWESDLMQPPNPEGSAHAPRRAGTVQKKDPVADGGSGWYQA